MSHPPKAGHTRVTIDLAPGQTVAQALGLGVGSGKADAYLRDLQAAAKFLDFPPMPKDGGFLLDWLGAAVASLKAEDDAATKPEDGAEFWRTGLREAALAVTGSHLSATAPPGFVRAVYECGRIAGEASMGQAIDFQASQLEAEAYERGRVAGLRAAVWTATWNPPAGAWNAKTNYAAFAPGANGGSYQDLRENGWGPNESAGDVRVFPTREEAQAAADAAPNWWEAGQ